jgi:hypothetical protein
MNYLPCIALIMGLAACVDYSATSARQAMDVSATPVAPVVCERVAPTGSNLSVTRCARPATASDHMDVRETVHNLAGPGAPAADPNGTSGH